MSKVPLLRNIQRAWDRYRNPTIKQVVALHRRARAMRSASKVNQARHKSDVRLIVSMTTIPARVGSLGTALNSLLDQSTGANRIILWVPRKSFRTGEPYPSPDSFKVHEDIEVILCEDEGPSTKLLPALLDEPEAAIVVVDDDVIYPHDFLEQLLRAHKEYPNCALGLRGVTLYEDVPFPALRHVMCSGIAEPADVNVLFGTWGYLVPPGALDEAVHNFEGYDQSLRWVDDVWISGHLARRGVRRLVVPTNSFPIETKASFVQALTDGPNQSGVNDAKAIAAFSDYWDDFC